MLPSCEFLCLSEWNETLYQEALDWVDDTRRVAILSDQLHTSDDPRVVIHCIDSPLQLEMMLKKIAWSAVFKTLSVIGPYREKLEHFHLAAHSILSEAADFWLGAMQNARANDKPYRRGMELKGAFEGIPAIIVGAGPSLESAHLKEFEERALIFAAGSALNIIDVEPHFAGSIDAHAPHEQFKKHPFSKTPFCYQSRMNSDNFALLRGERLLFPDGACEAINWIYDEELFDGGWTVGNFLTQVALLCGCSPIFFAGMDLCYDKGRKYAKIDADLPEGLVQLGDVWTQKDWIMAARWTEERKAKMFDLSSGILQLPKLSVDEALSLCSKRGDLRQLVQEAIQKLPVKQGGRWTEWEGEIVHEKLLEPLWNIWRPIFERENQNLELHKTLFLQRVLHEHAT